MSVYDTLCLLSAISILITLVNTKIGQLQPTIAITAWSLILSSVFLLSEFFWQVWIVRQAAYLINGIHFDNFLLKGILGFLLCCWRFEY